MYRFQKFARKHKPALATAAAIALCLILGTTVSAWQAVRATTAEAQANANADQAKETAQEATAQRDDAQRQRDEVKALNEKLQRTVYAAHMNLAQHAWDENVTSRTLELLDQHRPKPGVADLRGFEWHYLNRLCHAEILTIRASNAFLRGVTYSPDGKRLISKSLTGEIKVWDASTGEEVHAPEVEATKGTAYSPDGKYIASFKRDQASDTSMVVISEAKTGNEIRSLTKQSGAVQSIVFSPNGSRIASVSTRWDEEQKKFLPGELKIWDAATGRETVSLEVAGWQLAFGPDEQRLALVSSGKIRIYAAESGKELFSINSGNDNVALSPKHFAAAFFEPGTGWRIKIWDATNGKELQALGGHSDTQINSVAFSPDGKRLASAGGDRTAKVWDVETGKQHFAFKGHTNMVQQAVFSPDGTRLASASLDGTVKVWDTTTSPAARAFSNTIGRIFGMALSPDGKQFACGVGIGDWDEAKQSYATVELKILDAKSGQELRTIKGFTRIIRDVAFSPDGNRLATVSDDRTIRLWDAHSGRELRAVAVKDTRVYGLAFNPPGNRLAGIWDMNTAKIWDVETGREALSLEHINPADAPISAAGVRAHITSLIFTPDGKRLVTTSQNATKIWDAQSGTELRLLPALGSGMLSSLTFSPDGKRLASSQNSGPGGVGQVIVSDAQTGEILLTLSGHTASVSSIIYSPDGKRIVSAAGNPIGGNNGEVKIWDAETGLELLTIKGGGFGHRVTFAPDGQWLADCARGRLKIYDATPLPEKP